jgi:L-idonate 5-dehydrogenase
MMRAVFLEGPRTLVERETERPAVGPDDVLLKVHSMGICGSDIEYYMHNKCGAFVPRNPLVLGHELSGEVVEIGTAVRTLNMGTRVAIDPSMPCRVCKFCRAGRHNLCENLRFVGTAATFPHIAGGLSEYVSVPAANCHVIPDGVTWAEATCLEPLSVAVHACLRPGRIAGQKVLITGGGTIGQFVALAGRAFGAAVVAVSDIQAFRREFAAKQGADFGFDPTDAAELARVQEATGGFDLIFEASGAPPAIKQNLDLVNRGGTIVQIGTIARDVELPANLIMSKELSVIGSFRYGDIYSISMGLLAAKRVDVTPLISAVFPMSDTSKAFELAAERGNAIKILVEVGDWEN